MIKAFIGKVLLTLASIFVVMAIFAIYDHLSTDDENAKGAAISLFIVASFFAVPYAIFFRLKSKLDPNKKERKLTNRRCKNCSSTEFSVLNNGNNQCKHCGSIYS